MRQGTAETTPTSGARRYTLLRRLAVGGMGELFLARAAGAGGVQKLVAIKRVRPEYASDAAFVSMFLNEARLAATLDHPNIVRTYDLVEDDGSFFMVMEYLHGESLGTVLNAVSGRGDRVPLSNVVTIVLGVAAGLHCAHERRAVDGRPLDIVHRDLSPGNVLITYEGGVKLLDFGIAKATSRTAITIGPSRKGKVSYMSPEQCVGDDIDRRSDIFALGVVMWELCTGKRLFRGDNEFGIMNQITTLDAPAMTDAVPELPAELAKIAAKALCRDRDERFQTAMELHDALEAFARENSLLPSAPALGRYLEDTCGWREFPSAEATEEFAHRGATVVAREPAQPQRPRRWSIVAALAAGVTLGAIAVAAGSSESQQPPGDPTPATAPDPPEVAETPPPPAEPSPNLVPAPPVAPQELAEPPADPSPVRPRKRKKSKKKTPKGSKPDEPVRGVDGLLPRG